MASWITQHESVTIDPSASSWRCRDVTGKVELAATARRFREQVGLPVDRPVVMSGHQAGFWHAGIATKAFALEAGAERFGAGAAWVVVDQDVGAPARVAYPAIRGAERSGGSARVVRASTDLLEPEGARVVTGRQRVGPARGVVEALGASEPVARGLRRLASALDRHTDASSRAMQVSASSMDVLGVRAVLVSAMGLARTDVFAGLIASMRDDPGACTASYNAAVSRHPGARLRQLEASSRRGAELPLWTITPEGTREPVFASDLENPGAMAPRALTMTAMLRWAGCDLFIHGLGGGHYDPVMEQWLGEWLGLSGLAPAVVVTATRLMPMVEDQPPTPEEVARAVWAVHHARHDPASARISGGVVGASDSSEKRLLAARVREADGPERLARYRAMHEWVGRERALHGAALAALETRAADLVARSAMSGVVFDRTWSTALLPEASVASLRDVVRARVLG